MLLYFGSTEEPEGDSNSSGSYVATLSSGPSHEMAHFEF